MRTVVLSLVFVLLYSSGFVVVQYAISSVDPVSFLVLRFAITAVVLGLMCVISRPELPDSRTEIAHTMVAGALVVGTFSLGAFVAIAYGISGSTTALIISLQPLLASLIAMVLFNARVTVAQWLGLFIGFVGVLSIVFWGLRSPSPIGLVMAVLGLLGVASGSVYQKYYCTKMNLLFGGFLQSLSSCILCAIVWLFYPVNFIQWTPTFIFGLLWMAITVSIGAMMLFYLLIRKLSISKVSSLFYLMPISTLFQSILFLDGSISAFQGVGIILVSLSIFLVVYFEQKGKIKSG